MSDDRWWLECRDPRPLLQHLLAGATGRKKRLLLAGCVRRLGDLVPAGPLLNALVTSEEFADGLVGTARVAKAQREAQRHAGERHAARVGASVSRAPLAETAATLAHAAAHAVANALNPAAPSVGVFAVAQAAAKKALADKGERVPFDLPASHLQVVVELAGLCDIIRDVFGNPYRRVAFQRSWLTAHNGVAVTLARAVYEDRAFDRMPILADALEDGGCDSADLLTHLRGAADHVRGCWALDLVLGLN
jgi:hypothetical protein